MQPSPERTFIIGKGKSFLEIDPSKLKDEFTICLNHAVFYVPNPSALVFNDKGFYEYYSDFVDTFPGKVWTGSHSGRPNSINIPRPQKLLSGTFALEIAVRKTTGPIYLIGFDMNISKEYPYFMDYCDEIANKENFEKRDGTFRLWYENEGWAQKKLKVYDECFDAHKHRIFNCNKNSGIKTFKFVDFEEII